MNYAAIKKHDIKHILPQMKALPKRSRFPK